MKHNPAGNNDEKRNPRRPQRSQAAGADWGRIEADDIRSTIASAGAKGGALRFGYTRDGGAYAIGIYGLGEPYTEYLRPSDDIPGFLRELRGAFDDISIDWGERGGLKG